MAYRLGIDLGTTNTVAAIAVDGAPVAMVSLSGVLPADAVHAVRDEDGRLLVGRRGRGAAEADPSRVIQTRGANSAPTARCAAAEVTAERGDRRRAVSFVRDRATAQQGGPRPRRCSRYPARWSEYQLECFDRAIAAADLGAVRRAPRPKRPPPRTRSATRCPTAVASRSTTSAAGPAR